MWSLLPSCLHEPPRRRTRTCILAVRALLAPAKTLPRRGAQHLAPRGASTDIAQRKGVHEHLVADNFAAISTPKKSKTKKKQNKKQKMLRTTVAEETSVGLLRSPFNPLTLASWLPP